MADSLLIIEGLRVSVAGKEVVRGLHLSVPEGEVHGIMGPNGSGKSSLVSALMGHPAYTITNGSVMFRGEDLLAKAPEERARAGLFLAFQYPKEIAGVSLRSFLSAAYNAVRGEGKRLSPVKFARMLDAEMAALRMDPAFAERAVNKGFSGGEKKKAEVLQMSILRPRLALLDETDSGLDVDALKTVAEGINRLRSPSFSALVVTHYARLLDYVEPARVHVMVRGEIVESGGKDLALAIERDGYARYGVREGPIVLDTEKDAAL